MRKLASVLPMDLSGASALVTGGASGIGAATVDALHAAGARVAVFDLAATSTGDVHREIDIRDESAVVDGVRDVTQQLGRLDAAVLNAGVGGMAPVLKMTTDEWDRVMEVNARGTFVTLRECARAMVDGANGGA